MNLDEWKKSKGITFRSYTRRGKLTFIYSPSLVTAWKRLLIKAKVKNVIQRDTLAACFKNKLNLIKMEIKLLKIFWLKTEPYEVCDLLHTYFNFLCTKARTCDRTLQTAKPRYIRNGWLLHALSFFYRGNVFGSFGIN